MSTLRTTAFVAALGASAAQAQEIVPATAPPRDSEMLETLRRSLPFDIGGGFLLWYYDPFLDGAQDNTEIYYANLVLDGHFGDFGIHFEPRFRDGKLRSFFQSNVWVQELYMSWKPCDECDGVLKAGKVYSQFGRFWDGVFYGNIPYFDGLKLDPDLGLSWESKFGLGSHVSLDYSLQYFDRDGATNGSLPGRDTLSVGNDQTTSDRDAQQSFERNITVARVAPTFKFGEDTSLTVGASGMHFEADLDSTDDSSVTRANGELAFTAGGFTVFGDYTHQNGNHVVDFPVAGATPGSGSDSDDVDYLMSGASCQCGDWTFRGNYSFGKYHEDDVEEELFMPGVVWQFHPHFSLWLEYVYWQRDTDGDKDIVDRSVNLVLYGAF